MDKVRSDLEFQHSAARRRLRDRVKNALSAFCFNTQPRGGGCNYFKQNIVGDVEFQHSAARRRLPNGTSAAMPAALFQHSAARRRLPQLKPT